jgi:hypothetical protein
MAELFGAPLGFLASDENARKNVMSGLQSAELLGKLGMQPAELELTKAQTAEKIAGAENQRALATWHGAQALKALQEAADARAIQDLEEKARAGHIAELEAKGIQPNVQNTPPGKSFLQPTRASDYLVGLIEAAKKYGAPSRAMLPVLEKFATMRQHEAATESAQAQQIVHKLTADEKAMDALSGVAIDGMRNPEAWKVARAGAVARGLPGIDMIPENYQQASPILANLANASLSQKERLKIIAQTVTASANTVRADAAKTQAEVAVDRAAAAVEQSQARAEAIAKETGRKSEEADRRLKVLEDREKRLKETTDAKLFPPIGLPDTDWRGRTVFPSVSADSRTNANWTSSKGQKIRAVSDPDGKFIDRDGKTFSWVPFSGEQ